MLFSGRAYYNLLLLERSRGKNSSAEAWEYENYRTIALEELFLRLKEFEIYLDEPSFVEYCLPLDSPEDFCETFDLSEDDKRKVYLLGFELWRRLLPHKESISLFCDELDHTIASYEKDKNSEKLLQLLEAMVDILDQNSSEEDPHIIFKRLCLYVAHDLENVIYTYVNSKLGDGQDPYVDLLDHFMPYVKEKRALLFLKLKSISDVFSEEKDCLVEYLCSSLQENVHFPLSVAMLFFLIEKNHDELFKELFSFLVNEITDEKLLVTLLDVLIAFHTHKGRPKMKTAVSEFRKKKLEKPQKSKLTKVQKNKVLSFL